jgi:hypothetical protein
MIVEAAGKASAMTQAAAEATLSQVDEYQSPFVSAPGRSTPDWLREPIRTTRRNISSAEWPG